MREAVFGWGGGGGGGGGGGLLIHRPYSTAKMNILMCDMHVT